jgi:hypothetical protein
MRVIVLTLLFFMLLGIHATCRQPGLSADSPPPASGRFPGQ